MKKLFVLILLSIVVIGCSKNDDEDSIATSSQIEGSETNLNNADNSGNSNDTSQESSNDSDENSNENSNNESSDNSSDSKDDSDDSSNENSNNESSDSSSDSSNDSNSNNSDEGSNNSQSVDVGQYIVVAEGSGNIELVSHSENDYGIAVSVRITPSEGFTIWDLQGADLPENTYDLIHDVRGSFETTLNFKGGEVTPASVYLTESTLWYPTEGHSNSLEWHEGRGETYLANDMLDRAYEASTEYMNEVLRTARILWFPLYQTLPNGEFHERVANTAGGTSCSTDEDPHIIDMRHNSTAGVILHEAGHNVDNSCSISETQHQRSSNLHSIYLNRLVESGGDPQSHYQLGYGAGEWFACSTAAYFDTTGEYDLSDGAGTIREGYDTGREGLQNKYPEMFELMREIYN